MKTVRKPVAAIRGPKRAAPEPLADGIRSEKRPYGLLAVMSNEELVGYAEMLIASLSIEGRSELAKADAGLYEALRKRRLLDELGLEDLRGEVRDWASIGKEELVGYAKEFIAERGISGRGELEKADAGLYQALWKRKLLDELGLEDLRGEVRDWASIGKEELVGYAKEFIAERGISGRGELEKAGAGLYKAMWKRRLLDKLGLGHKLRDWTGMGKEELVGYTKKFIAERRISGREELKKADKGIYQALWKRKLLDAVFSDAESSRHADAVDGVIGALESFGDGK
jgi:hypothetical protein